MGDGAQGLARSPLPAASSKHYAEEACGRLMELLDRAQEIERMAELIEQEGLGRKRGTS